MKRLSAQDFGTVQCWPHSHPADEEILNARERVFREGEGQGLRGLPRSLFLRELGLQCTQTAPSDGPWHSRVSEQLLKLRVELRDAFGPESPPNKIAASR